MKLKVSVQDGLFVTDRVWLFQGWYAYNSISNNGKIFTPQELTERVKKELLKGAPRKETLMDAIGSMIQM